MKAFQRKLEEELRGLYILKNIYSAKEGWVVESTNHVNVGDGNGLNRTAFAVKSPMSCRYAQVFNTREQAEKQGADYYLVDGNHQPIPMIFTKAYDFFHREFENAKKLLVFINTGSK